MPSMPSILSPALRRLLGGETRAKVLGLLADATVPKTGYELAKAARANPSKVYGSLGHRILHSRGVHDGGRRRGLHGARGRQQGAARVALRPPRTNLAQRAVG